MNSPVSARKKIYRISLDAMLLAVNVVMNVAVPSEFSWATLPVLLCAFLLRPADTVAVAVLGSFVEQLFYGLGPQTVLWILPWLVFSLYVGFGAVWARRRESVLPMILVVVSGELLLNVCNTTVLLYFGYLVSSLSETTDTMTAFFEKIKISNMNGKLFTALVYVVFYFGRMINAIVRAVLSATVLPLLLEPLCRVLAKLKIGS